MRTTPKISIALEGDSWQDILREMSIIEASVRGARIEDLPEQTNIAKEERSGQDGAEKPVCAYCGSRADTIQAYQNNGNVFCSWPCSDRYDHSNLGKLSEVLKDYDLGPEERAEIMERVR